MIGKLHLSIQNLAKLVFSEKLIRFVGYLINLSLLFYLAYQFKLEHGTRLPQLLMIILVAFFIHYWLPGKWKLPFFLGTSFIAILAIIGFSSGCYLILVGLLLISLCHLPIAYKKRLGIITIVVTILILIRINFIQNVEFSIIIPFIGSMFMLRLMLYLYDLKYLDNHDNSLKRLSYFFMLPNVCFPLFPLIDYKVYMSSYHTDPDVEHYNLALRRIFRGVIHLLTYKFIYLLVIPDTADIESIYDLITFMVFSYTLVLRLTGMFHLVLGILGLFGFNLPPIFNNIFFASGFNDLWRRVNIYWREALIKLVYFPVYFALKRTYRSHAVVLAIIAVFAFNWFLHGYQLLWMTGYFPFIPNDILFWFLIGMGVMVNTIYLKNRLNKKREETRRSEMFLVLKTMVMFIFMCFMWMLWSSSSLTEFVYLLTFVTKGTLIDFGIIILGCFTKIVICYALLISYKRGLLKKLISIYQQRIITTHSLISLVLVGFTFQSFVMPAIDDI
ncbi:MAG: hypothetical protein WBA16_08940 [Nonlabens sp.]